MFLRGWILNENRAIRWHQGAARNELKAPLAGSVYNTPERISLDVTETFL